MVLCPDCPAGYTVSGNYYEGKVKYVAAIPIGNRKQIKCSTLYTLYRDCSYTFVSKCVLLIHKGQYVSTLKLVLVVVVVVVVFQLYVTLHLSFLLKNKSFCHTCFHSFI